MSGTEESYDRTERLAGELGTLIAARRYPEASAELAELLEPDVAEVLRALEEDACLVAFRMLPHERQAAVFSYFKPTEQERLIESITSEQAAKLFNEMEPDDRVDFLEVAADELAQRLLGQMHPQERADTQRILEFPDESIGRDMTTEFLTVRPEWTAQKVLEHIREHGSDVELLNGLYVVDSRGRLIDFIRLRELLLADPDTPCGDLVEEMVVSVRATDDREEAVHVFKKYDLPVLPVVDEHSVLLGIITFDDLQDVAEEEVTEDMQKMAAVEAFDEPYMSVSLPVLFRKRVFWLLVLFAGGLLTVFAMTRFEDSIKRFAILAMFVPLIIASGGNSGSQAASLMIRALALGELRPRDWVRVFRRELISGLMLGGLLGLCGVFSGAAISYYLFHAEAPDPQTAWLFGFAIGTSVLGVVMVGTLTGSMLPFVLEAVGLDPAVGSTPFVATIVDVAGLIIYFVSASVILQSLIAG